MVSWNQFVHKSLLRTGVKTELEESVDQSVANLNMTVRQMLASHWSRTVMRPEYWPLIGPEQSCDLNIAPWSSYVM